MSFLFDEFSKFSKKRAQMLPIKMKNEGVDKIGGVC